MKTATKRRPVGSPGGRTRAAAGAAQVVAPPGKRAEQCGVAAVGQAMAARHVRRSLVTVYGSDGHIKSDNNIVNSSTVKLNTDGTFTVYFGSKASCGDVGNRLDVSDGWNYVMRIYRAPAPRWPTGPTSYQRLSRTAVKQH